MTAGTRARPVDRDLLVALAIGGGLAAIALAAAVIRPLEAATIDPDAAASVIYFERILGGSRLEAFLPTTPKPLLTVVFGLGWSALHDWRAFVWASLVAFGGAVVLAGWWIGRVARGVVGPARPAAASAGAFVAAGFAMTALALSSDAVLEVSRANSLVWALVGWLIAGLAMTGSRRRPGLAGVALLLAGLARFETLAIIGAAGVALAIWALLARAGRSEPPSRRDWLVLVGLLTLPIACLHDLLLTGDPFYWANVPARYTQLYVPGAESVGPLEYAMVLASRYLTDWPTLLLAGIGLTALVARRAWVAVVGLGGLAGGVLVLLFALAWRGTYISSRYDEPLDLALLGLAGVGAGTLVALAIGRGARTASTRWTPAGLALATLGGAALALVVGWPPALLDSRVGRELDLVRTASENLSVYMSRLAGLAAPPGSGEASPDGRGPVGAPLADPEGARLFVPSLLRPRIAVETGAPLTALGDTYADFVASIPWAGLHADQRIYHDHAADRPDALDAALEADPVVLGEAAASIELVDDERGIRVLRVTLPPSP